MRPAVDRLVILGSSLTSLSLVRHCAYLGLKCVVIDTMPGPACYSNIPRVVLLDTVLDQAILEKVVLAAEGVKSALIADSDEWLRWITRHRHALQAAFKTILHGNSDTLDTCLDKSRFLAWCAEKGLPAPKLFRVSRTNMAGVSFPVMVRPQVTRHRMTDDLPKARQVLSSVELSDLLRRFDEQGAVATVSESLLRTNVVQLSVGLARNINGDVKALVAEKMRPSAHWCSGGTYVITKPDVKATELAVAAATALSIFGIAEIEIIKDLDSGSMYLIEVNPRPWVQYSLSWKSGFDFLTFLLDPDSYDSSKERTQGKRWLSLRDDLYVAFAKSGGMVRSGKIGVCLYALSILRANVFPLWNFRDPKPWRSSMLRGLPGRRRNVT
jgi:predicted ATP-grasp superfamily ATP-dependent carboligase